MSEVNNLLARIQQPLKRIKQKLLGSIERRLEYFEYKMSVSHMIASCVRHPEDRVLLHTALINSDGVHAKTRIVIDSRPSCVEMMDAYLNWVRPVAMPYLVRIATQGDGGYVMSPPPPILKGNPKPFH
ncbi:hypothetical protein [Helicobacter mehlei]|uniref:hypothetical protein n=1 Tax=Helicobacter mehlei TaxID=2316080 RepID=UPI000EABCE4E|nr:hypothetical protein [Helicobacter mehlei]